MSGDDEKPKGVDISQVGKVNAGNDDQSEPVRRIVDRTAQLSVGGRALQGALRGLGGVSALAEAARAASSVTMLKDQLDALTGVSVFTEQMKAQQKAMRALALPDVSAFSGITALADQFKIEQDAFAQARNLALGGLPGGFLNAITGSATGAASRFFQDMREQSSLINQHMDMFADMRRALKA